MVLGKRRRGAKEEGEHTGSDLLVKVGEGWVNERAGRRWSGPGGLLQCHTMTSAESPNADFKLKEAAPRAPICSGSNRPGNVMQLVSWPSGERRSPGRPRMPGLPTLPLARLGSRPSPGPGTPRARVPMQKGPSRSHWCYQCQCQRLQLERDWAGWEGPQSSHRHHHGAWGAMKSQAVHCPGPAAVACGPCGTHWHRGQAPPWVRTHLASLWHWQSQRLFRALLVDQPLLPCHLPIHFHYQCCHGRNHWPRPRTGSHSLQRQSCCQ